MCCRVIYIRRPGPGWGLRLPSQVGGSPEAGRAVDGPGQFKLSLSLARSHSQFSLELEVRWTPQGQAQLELMLALMLA